MQYGRVHIKHPAVFAENKAALVDLLAKGEIDQPTYNKKLRDLDRQYLLFIARTNSMNIGGKRDKKTKQTIGDWRNEFTRAKTLEIAEQVTKNMVGPEEPNSALTPEDLAVYAKNIQDRKFESLPLRDLEVQEMPSISNSDPEPASEQV